MARVINDDTLKDKLLSDLKLINIPTDFNLEFRSYSKSYYGTYDCRTRKIVMYITDEEDRVVSYNDLLDTALHEAIHHYQFCHNKDYVRLKGVMHNEEFHFLYDYKLRELKDMGVLDYDYTPH